MYPPPPGTFSCCCNLSPRTFLPIAMWTPQRPTSFTLQAQASGIIYNCHFLSLLNEGLQSRIGLVWQVSRGCELSVNEIQHVLRADPILCREMPILSLEPLSPNPEFRALESIVDFTRFFTVLNEPGFAIDYGRHRHFSNENISWNQFCRFCHCFLVGTCSLQNGPTSCLALQCEYWSSIMRACLRTTHGHRALQGGPEARRISIY